MLTLLAGKAVMVAMMALFGQSLVSSLKNPVYLILAIAIWAGDFPGLFAESLEIWNGEGEARVGRAVARRPGGPQAASSQRSRRSERLSGDAALLARRHHLLANEIAPVESPIDALSR